MSTVPNYQAGTYQILDKLAAKVINRISQLDLADDFANLRPEIAATYVAAVMVGSEAVGYFSVEQYHQLREAAGITDRFEAEMLDLDLDQVREQARRIAYQALRLDDAETIGREVAGKMAQAVRDHGFNTTSHNMARDPRGPRYTVTLTCNTSRCAKKNRPEWQCANVAEELRNLGPDEAPEHWFHPGCRCHVKPNWTNGPSRLGGTRDGKVQRAPQHAAKLGRSTLATSPGLFGSKPDPEELRAGTNPNYGQRGYGNNCNRVVHAFEMRARGYDVTAMPNPGDDWGIARNYLTALDGAIDRARASGRDVASVQVRNKIAKLDPAAAARIVTDPAQYVRDVVSSWPEGARGYVRFSRAVGAGHVFNIENTANGPRAIEAQIPNASNMNLDNYMSEVERVRSRRGTYYLPSANNGLGSLTVIRVDDLDFNEELVKEKAITWTGKKP